MFETITLSWKGRDYRIPPNRVLPAIVVVEEHVTLDALARMQRTGAFQHGRLARAYGALLRYAGAEVTDEEVHVTLFGSDAAAVLDTVVTFVEALQVLMIPPESLRAEAGKAAAAAAEKPAPSPQPTS